MLNIGPLELMMIAVVALVVVGPRKLPEIGRQAGKLIRDLRKMQDEVKDTIRFDLDEDEDDEPPTARARSSAREHRAHDSKVARGADDFDEGGDDGDPDPTEDPDRAEEPAERTRPVSASDAARAQTRAKERRAAAGQDADEPDPGPRPPDPASNGGAVSGPAGGEAPASEEP